MTTKTNPYCTLILKYGRLSSRGLFEVFTFNDSDQLVIVYLLYFLVFLVPTVEVFKKEDEKSSEIWNLKNLRGQC